MPIVLKAGVTHIKQAEIWLSMRMEGKGEKTKGQVTMVWDHGASVLPTHRQQEPLGIGNRRMG